MGDKARKLRVEAASPIGGNWIFVIPYNPTLCNSPAPVPLGHRHCPWFEDKANLGHHELCLARSRSTIGRRNVTVRTIGPYLASDHSTQAEIEPHIHKGRRRNDNQREGAYSHGKATAHLDIKVVFLLGAKSHRTTTEAPAETEMVTHATKQCNKHLDSIGRHAISVRRYPTAVIRKIQAPCSVNGEQMSKGRADELQQLKSVSRRTIRLALARVSGGSCCCRVLLLRQVLEFCSSACQRIVGQVALQLACSGTTLGCSACAFPVLPPTILADCYQVSN